MMNDNLNLLERQADAFWIRAQRVALRDSALSSPSITGPYLFA